VIAAKTAIHMAVQTADKEGKNVVFPSLWLSAENQ
jgi:hypothetical protein